MSHLNTEDLQTEADRLRGQRSFGEALPLYAELIHERGKDTALNRHYIGVCHADAHDYEASILSYSEAISLGADSWPVTFFGRGLSYFHLQRYEEAISDLSDAIRLRPEDSKAYCQRSECYRAFGDLESAQQDIVEAIRLAPANGRYYTCRALLCSRMGLDEAAVNDYTHSLELGNCHPNVFFNRGRCLVRLGRLDESLDDFQEAIRLNSAFTRAYLARGEVYQKLERFDSASRDFESALLLGDSSSLQDQIQQHLSDIQRLQRLQQMTEEEEEEMEEEAHVFSLFESFLQKNEMIQDIDSFRKAGLDNLEDILVLVEDEELLRAIVPQKILRMRLVRGVRELNMVLPREELLVPIDDIPSLFECIGISEYQISLLTERVNQLKDLISLIEDEETLQQILPRRFKRMKFVKKVKQLLKWDEEGYPIPSALQTRLRAMRDEIYLLKDKCLALQVIIDLTIQEEEEEEEEGTQRKKGRKGHSIVDRVTKKQNAIDSIRSKLDFIKDLLIRVERVGRRQDPDQHSDLLLYQLLNEELSLELELELGDEEDEEFEVLELPTTTLISVDFWGSLYVKYSKELLELRRACEELESHVDEGTEVSHLTPCMDYASIADRLVENVVQSDSLSSMDQFAHLRLDFSALDSMELPPNARIAWDAIEQRELVGQDAFLSVYSSKYGQSEVAVKETAITSMDELRLACEEFKRLFDLQHDSVVQVYGYSYFPSATKPIFRIIMELMTSSLSKIVRVRSESALSGVIDFPRRLTLLQKFSILQQCSNVLAFLHRCNCVHGDIKSNNFLVRYNDLRCGPEDPEFDLVVKITDLHLSQDIQETTNSSAGSFFWMSPEQLEDGIIGASQEVFSFGMLCYEVLHGCVPFHSRYDPLSDMINTVNIRHAVCVMDYRPSLTLLKNEEDGCPEFAELLEEVWKRPILAKFDSMEKVVRWFDEMEEDFRRKYSRRIFHDLAFPLSFGAVEEEDEDHLENEEELPEGGFKMISEDDM